MAENKGVCDTTLRCEGNITHAKWVHAFPKEEQINLHPRPRSRRARG
jgi:hypothetical protein